ncbi:hypothetical protein [Burkholderia cepacia]|uniref:hypothetical protein n=1 Tax=Burkholderia cepacia TaxID=292 RepID=UPI001CF4EDD4|nr:hypothetical protein [Burkholderia cepacia]MCA7941687.1 hypothetical protein [Burkholderia cepacia]
MRPAARAGLQEEAELEPHEYPKQVVHTLLDPTCERREEMLRVGVWVKHGREKPRVELLIESEGKRTADILDRLVEDRRADHTLAEANSLIGDDQAKQRTCDLDRLGDVFFTRHQFLALLAA